MPTLIAYPTSGLSAVSAPAVSGGSGVTTVYEAVHIALWKVIEQARFWTIQTDGGGIKIGPGTVEPVCFLNELRGAFDIDHQVGTHLRMRSTNKTWQIRLEFNQRATVEDLERLFVQAPPLIPSYPKLEMRSGRIFLRNTEIEHPREENGAVGTIAILTLEVREAGGKKPFS